MKSYHDGPHALSGIARTEERIAFAVTPATFMELVRVSGCYVIREHDFFDGNIYILGAAYSTAHIAGLWLRLTNDETTHHELIVGRLA